MPRSRPSGDPFDGRLGDPVRATVSTVGDGRQLWSTFLNVNIHAKMQIEDLRQEYCDVCRCTPDLALRHRLCEKKRCGLMDPVAFANEWIVLHGLIERVRHLESAEGRDLALLNDYIEDAGAVTPALMRGRDGHLRRGYSMPTLRAMLHGTLIDLLAWSGGDMLHAHAREVGGKGAKRLAEWVGALNEANEKHRARALLREGVPLAEVARRLKRSRNTVAGWRDEEEMASG